LGLGVAFWAGYDVPLHVHMAFGGLLVVALWGLAVQVRARAAGLALAAGVWGGVVPVLGMLQLLLSLGEDQWVLQGLHLAAGLGSIVLAEFLAKRLRSPASPSNPPIFIENETTP